jgi:hypothetical protein
MYRLNRKWDYGGIGRERVLVDGSAVGLAVLVSGGAALTYLAKEWMRLWMAG